MNAPWTRLETLRRDLSVHEMRQGRMSHPERVTDMRRPSAHARTTGMLTASSGRFTQGKGQYASV